MPALIPGDLVTLSGLVAAAHLNGLVACVASKDTQTGRVAVRLATDGSVISVKEECAVCGVPVDTRVSVKGDVGSLPYEMSTARGGLATGTVLQNIPPHNFLVLLDDGNEVEASRGDVELLSLQVMLAELYNLAEAGRKEAQDATMLGAAACRKLRGKIQQSLDAARRLRHMCDNPIQRAMAALTELELLRYSIDIEVQALRWPRAVQKCNDAVVLANLPDVWSDLPSERETTASYHLVHSLIYLHRVTILWSHGELRGIKDTEPALFEQLKLAYKSAKQADDQQSIAMVLMQRVSMCCQNRQCDVVEGGEILANIAELESTLEAHAASHAYDSDWWRALRSCQIKLHQSRATMHIWMGNRDAHLDALRAGTHMYIHTRRSLQAFSRAMHAGTCLRQLKGDDANSAHEGGEGV